MPGRIPENVLEDILSRIDIVGLISGYLPLKKAGRNFKALCPFHHEKTGSFMISPDRQIYHCFGCGESGNAFKFLMRYERMDFPEAVEALAKKAGVALPKFHEQDAKAESLASQLYKANELAAEFYAANLAALDGSKARNYLAQRGITQETIKNFKLGYAVDRWDGFLNYARAKGVGIALLEKAGLILPRNSGGGYYDRFRDRLIFSIVDLKGRPLGFGARILAQNQSDQPKYVNSPETSVYTKGKNLFGLNASKEEIRQQDCAVVVEGYLDFLMPYQEGVRNIVASLGTALTQEQVRLLKRYTSNVVMVYDPDAAGQMATLRSLDIFIEEGMSVKVASLPQGCDPDLFVRKSGIQAFQDKIANAETLFDYKLNSLRSKHDARQIEGRSRICSEMLPVISKFTDAVLKTGYLKRLSEELSVEEDALLQELKKVKTEKPYADSGKALPRKPLDIRPAEKLLIKLMLEESGLIGRVRDCLVPADFQDERASKIVTLMFELLEQGRNIEPNLLASRLQDEATVECICESAFLPEVSLEKKEQILNDCVRRIKDEKIKSMQQRLHEEIKAAQHLGDEEKVNRLMQEFHELIKTR